MLHVVRSHALSARGYSSRRPIHHPAGTRGHIRWPGEWYPALVMSPELISIFAVGFALAGLILNGQRRTDARFDRLEKRMSALEQRMTALEQRMAESEKRTSALEVQQSALKTELLERMAGLQMELLERMAKLETELRVRMAKLEGLLEGLREALTGRRVA